jgi:hypothetical protein
LRKAAVPFLALAVCGLAACNKAQPDSVDDTALEAIGAAASAELNTAPKAIVDLLKVLDRPTPIGLDALQVSLDQKATPVDWWLLQHHLIIPITPPPTPGTPTFLVSHDGAQLAAQAPVWFNAIAATPSRVDCHSTNVQAAGGCEVELTLTTQATEAGAAVIGPAAAGLDPIKVQAIVAQNADGWQVRDLRAEGSTLQDFALNALLGKEAARAAARQQVLASLNQGLAQSAAQDASVAGAANAVAGPPPDTMTVSPVIGDSSYAARHIPGIR